MEQDLKLVDAVCEILDARIPISSRNPDIAAICGQKPRLVILNRMDMADPGMTRAWCEEFRRQGLAAVATDCKSRKGVSAFVRQFGICCRKSFGAMRKRGKTAR